MPTSGGGFQSFRLLLYKFLGMTFTFAMCCMGAVQRHIRQSNPAALGRLQGSCKARHYQPNPTQIILLSQKAGKRTESPFKSKSEEGERADTCVSDGEGKSWMQTVLPWSTVLQYNCSALTPTVKNPLTGRNLLQPGSNWRDSESLGRCMLGQSRTLQPAVDCAPGLQPLKMLTFSHDYFYLTFVFLLGKTCSFFLTT